MNQIPDTTKLRHALLIAPLLALPLAGQSVGAPGEETEEDVVVLSPFEVSSEAETGYAAATTLAGNRLNTELRDIGNAVSVITSQFLKDTGAVNNETLLQYTTGTEVGNIQGNFTGLGDGALLSETDRFRNPNSNTRVRGLAEADNTRDFFLTSIPWDGYNVDRVDLQRGPNSILFGHGSPAGIINTGLKQASFRNANEIDIRFGSYGSTRATLDVNRVLIEDELAIRVAALRDDEKFQQDPAFEEDSRLYAALRWEPGFLKKGGARTILKANFEAGEIDSNRPRTTPPIDLITPWFMSGTYQGRLANGSTITYNHLNRQTFNPHQLQDDNTGRPNHGQTRPSYNGGPLAGQPNPAFNPWIGNFAQSFGGPLAYYSGGDASLPASYWVQEAMERKAIGPTGAVDQDVGGFAFHRPGGIALYANYARSARLPFAEFGIYKHQHITDPSIFNFYDNLLEGPNKKEWQDFKTGNVSLTQTFMDDKFGFEAVYNKESYNDGQLSMLTGGHQAIYIDINNVHSDGTPAGDGVEPFQDGTANPNVGRPFISDSGQSNNNDNHTDRDSARATAFFTHDFSEGSDHWLATFLGRHTLTGLVSQDTVRQDQRNFQRYAILDPDYYNFVRATTSQKFNDNWFAPNRVIYLGPSLADRSSIQGADIPNPTTTAELPASANVRVFDSTWNAHNVNPSAYWRNEYYLPGDTRGDSTQAENPANYVGWIDYPVDITDSEAAPGNRDTLTTSARLTKSRVSSRAFVWQAHLWDNAIVGTFGYREDTAKSWNLQRTVTNSLPGFGILDLGPTYRLPTDPVNVIDVTSRAHSIVAHLNDFPFLDELTEALPFEVSLFYNESSNFRPEAQRVNIYGEAIAAPSGETQDRGILLETKDGKYSFKVNKYKTTMLNATSSALGGAWFIGRSQAWAANWVNRFQYNWNADTIAGADPSRNDLETGVSYNYGAGQKPDGTAETPEETRAREQAAIAAWRTWQASVPQKFYDAWQINLNDNTRAVNSVDPVGLTVTEDSISEGYEFEFNAQPTRNWRITFNATKTKAIRTNIGGEALTEFVTAYQNALRNTAAGDVRIWWGGAGNETTLFQWNSNVGSNYTQKKLTEGTNVPEMREWRFNVVTNYDFTEGMLKGFNAGIGVRWQDEIVIGYEPIPGARPDEISFNLDDPYMGPSETNVDFWIGYGRKLTDRIDWRIQLNVRNAFEDDGLIPITTQPDGTPAGYRIAPSQVWTVSNTFRF